jgi:predicted phosphodiesterase
MRILLIGDSHGNYPFVKQAMELAVSAECELAISLGDFGFWPTSPTARGKRFDNRVKKLVKTLGIPLWVIDGNHDFPGVEPGDGGYKWVTDVGGDFQHLSRGSTFDLAGVRFGIMGGAISVDRGRRTLGRSYWIEEMVNDLDVERAVNNGRVDVWLTHDAVGLPPTIEPRPWPPHLQADLNVQAEKMRTVFNAVKPQLHVHGHFHYRYSAPTAYGKVIGLDYEKSAALYVLDTEQL